MSTSQKSDQGEPRQCFYVSAMQFDENGFIPSLVTEGKSGHAPMTGNGPFAAPWYWGNTLDEAKAICEQMNERRGISKADASEIVCSSMFAGPRH